MTEAPGAGSAAGHDRDALVGLGAIHEALVLSGHVVSVDAGQLGAQLHGRLMGSPFPAVQRLLSGCLRDSRRPWLRPLRRTLFGPGSGLVRTAFTGLGEPRQIAVTAGASRAALSTADGELALVELERQARVSVLDTAADAVPRFSLSPDEQLLLSWSTQDARVRVWSVSTGQSLARLEGHESALTAFALTDDGRSAASASRDGVIRIWDLRSFSCAHVLEGHAAPVTALAFAPDGLRIVSGSGGGTLEVWDADEGRLLHTLEGHERAVRAIDVCASRRVAVTGSDDASLKLWDIDIGELQRTADAIDPVIFVAVTPDGGHAIAQGEGDSWWTFNVWHLRSGALRRPEGHQDELLGVALMPGGATAVSWARDATIKIWDVQAGSLLHTLGEEREGQPVWDVAVDAEGRRLAAAGGKGQSVLSVWDATTGESLGEVEAHTGRISRVSLVEDGTRCVSASPDALRVWDVEELGGSKLRSDHPGGDVYVAVCPDGRRAVTTGLWGRAIRFWELATGETVDSNPRPWVSELRALTPDGHAVTASHFGELAIEDAGIRLKVQDAEVSVLALASAEPRLVTAGDDGMLTLWDWAAGRSLAGVRDPGGKPSAVAVAADGSRVLSGHVDGRVTVWEVAGATMSAVAGFHAHSPVRAASTWDGRLVALVCDRRFEVWNSDPGGRVATFTADLDLQRCAIAPSGHAVVADSSGRCHFLQLVLPERMQGN
jgi:WD40 repeat protein